MIRPINLMKRLWGGRTVFGVFDYCPSVGHLVECTSLFKTPSLIGLGNRGVLPCMGLLIYSWMVGFSKNVA